MNEAQAELEELLAQIWNALETASRDLQSPLRSPVLATTNGRECAVRTVILRLPDRQRRQLACFSDLRAGKIDQLRSNSFVQWHFYNSSEKIQIRASGRARVHSGDALTRAAWQEVPVLNRTNYCTTLPPGSAIARPEEALPLQLRDRSLTVAESEAGFQNFAVILTTIDSLDWLQLGYPLHRRAIFSWGGKEFVGRWATP